MLPAYNEADRIGPGLDELFGYLRRTRRRGRARARRASALPEHIEVLVIDDGSTDGTAAIVAARAEARSPASRSCEASGRDRPARRARVPPSGPGCFSPTPTSIVFADADMATPPDQLPLLVAALADHDLALGSRIQPDGSDMRASQPGYRRLFGKAFHLLASVWAVGPVEDTQCGFKGFTRQAAHDLFEMTRVTSIVFDVEVIFLARRRGYRIAVVPIRWEDRLGSRMHAGPAARHARRVGPVPDPADPSADPAARRPADLMDAARLGRLGRAALPTVAIAVFALTMVAILATAGSTVGYDYRAYVGAAQRALDGKPLYDMAVDVAGGFAIFLYPPMFALAFVPFALLPDAAGLWLWEGLAIASIPRRSRDPARPTRRPMGRSAVGSVGLAAPVCGQARPGRAAAVPAVRGRLALPRPGRPARTQHGGRGDDQGPAADPAGLGRFDRPVACGGRFAS